MIESSIEDFCVGWAIRHGYFVRKVQWIGRASAPDRLIAGRGRTAFVEFKRTGGVPRALQAREIAEMRRYGIEVHVVDGIEEFIRLFG